MINGNSTLNRVEITDSYGVRTASTPYAFALYDKTFIGDIALQASMTMVQRERLYLASMLMGNGEENLPYMASPAPTSRTHVPSFS